VQLALENPMIRRPSWTYISDNPSHVRSSLHGNQRTNISFQ
jgi:hypothetical protein